MTRLISVVLCALALLACGPAPSSVNSSATASLPPATATSPAATRDGVVVTLTWDEWQDLLNCLYFVSGDIGLTLEVASAELDAATIAEANETSDRLTRLRMKLGQTAEKGSEGIPVNELKAILDAQMIRTDEFTDLQTRLFDARMTALVRQVAGE